MAVLTDDVIVEIVVRLPLKNAIRCLLLNKKLFGVISQRKNALVSSWYGDIKSSIFYRHGNNVNNLSLKRFTPGGREISIALPDDDEESYPSIIDSCNGVLLIVFSSIPCMKPSLYVFNPITGGLMFIDSPAFKLGRPNLAVDLDAHNSSTFHFKLVMVQINIHSNEWGITILVPSSSSSNSRRPDWSVKHVEFKGSRHYPKSSAYVHGCMYWPQEEMPNIMVYDVKKHKIGMISWPFSKSPYLFGLSDGTLHSVCDLENEITIHLYDQIKDEWQLKHKITNTVPLWRISYFNGQHLLVEQKKGPRIVVHDILSDNKLENISGDGFFPFVPTLAKVSDQSLVKNECCFPSLEALQRLIIKD